MGGIPGELLGAVRVLLIEDERTTAMVIEGHLAAITAVRCSTDIVPTLAKARERLAAARYDLVIADLHLPDSPAAQTIAALTGICTQPVIALTVDESAELRRAALDNGAYDFLLKSQVADGTLDRPVRLAALQARTLESLRRSEARLRAIVNAEPECVKLLDAAGRLVDMNPAGLAMIEADDLERVRGHCVYDLVTPEHRDAFRSLTERAARGEAGSLVFEIVGVKGVRRWMETRVVPLRDESGEPLVLGIARDITSQRHTEKALQESEERFRKLTELSSDWYWEQDAEYRLTFMSTLLAQKTGLDAGAYLGRRRWDHPALNLTEADWTRHRAQLERHEPFRNFEMQRPAPGGGTRWLSISGEPVFNSAGQFKGYRGVGRNITQQKQAEQRLRLEHGVNRVLAEAEGVSGVVTGVLRAICEAEGWDCGRYFTIQPSGTTRLEEAWTNGSPEAERFIAESRKLEFAPGVGLVGAVWQSGAPLWVQDAQNDSRSRLHFSGWPRGAFICPVHSEGRIVGILALTSRITRPPDERFIEAISVIARQVGQYVQRKQAEQVVRESESRFRSLTELSSDWYWEQDAQFRFTELTGPGAQHLANGDPANYLGKTRWDTPDLAPVDGDWAAHRAMLERHEPFHDLVLRRHMADGSARYMSISGKPMFGAAGEFRGYRGIAKNVTEKVVADQALRESEARFRSLVELSSDFYWETDAEHRMTRTTRPEKHRPASTPVLGKTRWELPSLYPDEAGWAAHRATLTARKPFRDFELGRIDPDGEARFLSISGEPMFDAQGTFVGYRGVGREVTERRREERLVGLEHAVSRYLAESKTVSSALRAVMRAICEAENWECGRYFQLDEAASVMRCQETWSSGAGALARFAERSRGVAIAPGQGLIGHVWQTGDPVWSSDVSKDPRASNAARVREAGVHGAIILPVTFEGRTVGVLSVSSSTVRRPDERLMGTMRLVGAQIGQFLQRKQAEAALAESERRFRQTFELAASGMAQVDLAGRFIDVNRKLCDMLGYTEAELLGRSVKDVSHADDRDMTDAQRERMRSGEVPSVQFEKRYLRRDGSILWVNLTVALVRNAHGDPQYEIAVIEGIAERKEREGTLQRFRAALDSSADMVFLFDLSAGKLLDFNQTACHMLGYTREELLRLRARDIRPAATSSTLKAEAAELLGTAGRTNMGVTEYRRKDGSTFPVESRRSLLDTPQGRVLVVNSRDLTERTAAEKRRAAQARYQKKISKLGQAALSKRNSTELVGKAVQSVLEGLGGGAVAYLERSGTDREITLRRVAGLGSGPIDSAVARIAPQSALAPVLDGSQPVVLNGPWGDALPLPFEWLRRYGTLAAVPVPADGGPRGIVCAFAEAPNAFGPEETRFLGAAASMVSAALHRLDSEARLAYLAQFDPLTGLPNRALLADRFSLMIVQARRRNVSLGVLFIDLDDFKLVNDSQGHAAGDELLKVTATRLQESLRDGDTVARISGDEFAVILGDLARPDDAALVAQKILDRLVAPAQIQGQEVVVTASVGIATFAADGDNAETLLGAADAAMYRAKQSGRNAFQFFTADINQRTRARAQMGLELRRALERREFHLAYQPKIDLSSGNPCGAEALLRWKHPERGFVAPVEFIPVLEETGLIVPVGEWVLRRACEDLKEWQRKGGPAMPVAVNLSARQFRQHDLEDRIRTIVTSAGIEPSLVELEITESQLMHDPDHATRVLRALGAAGVRIAIDDFGTGYSSLAYLTRFPLASLKIDRSFVADVLEDEADATIVRTIVDMAHTLGFTVIAEGVELDSQAAFLRALGCEQAQGFLFARPMPAEDFSALIAKRVGAAAASRPKRSGTKRRKSG